MILTMRFSVPKRKDVKRFLRLLLSRTGMAFSLQGIIKGPCPHKFSANVKFAYVSFWDDFIADGAEQYYDLFNEDPSATIRLLEEESRATTDALRQQRRRRGLEATR